jgi:hypothetical protein
MDDKNLISEFFYDGISRVIPGLTVIALYGRYILQNAFSDFRDASIVLVICIFLAAWVIGAIIEMVTFDPWAFLIRWLSKLMKWAIAKAKHHAIDKSKSWLEKTLLLPVHKIPDKLKDNPRRLRQIYKQGAEKIMFRCLWAISVFTYFKHPEPFWGIEWNPCFSIIGAVSFGLAYIFWWFAYRCNQKEKMIEITAT